MMPSPQGAPMQGAPAQGKPSPEEIKKMLKQAIMELKRIAEENGIDLEDLMEGEDSGEMMPPPKPPSLM